MNFIVFRPTMSCGAAAAISLLKTRATLVLDISELEESVCQSFVDQVSGAAYMMNFWQRKLHDSLFVFAPQDVFLTCLEVFDL